MFGWSRSNIITSTTTLAELPIGSIKFISIKECVGFIENTNQEGQIISFLILFNSKTSKFISEKKGKYIIKVMVKKDGVIEPLNTDEEIIKRILFNKEVEVFDPPRNYEEFQNIQTHIQKKLSSGFQRFAGRTLSLNEKELIKNSFGEYIPKKINQKIKLKELMNRLLDELVFSREILQKTLNAANFDRISQGVKPESPNLLFFGPGGTGKSELLITLSQIYEEKLGCYVAYQNENTKNLLKGSEVEGSKGNVGAYEDTYVPILRKAIKEARIRGVPSIIPIDEGDIFVKNPNIDRNPHGDDVINFFKSYAGNYDELMFIISSNLQKNELDGPATRDGRMNIVYVGSPEQEEMIKLFREIFLNKYISNNKLEISPSLNEEDFKFICENLVKFQVTGARLKKFFIELTSKKKIDFDNIEDNFTLGDMYLMNVEKTSISKEEFFNTLQSFFGIFENYNNSHNHSSDENNDINSGLTQFYNKIINEGKNSTYSYFFNSTSQYVIIENIKKFYRKFHNFTNSKNENEKQIANEVIKFLNYCKDNLEKNHVDINSSINYTIN